jgi:hypothetical protein
MDSSGRFSGQQRENRAIRAANALTQPELSSAVLAARRHDIWVMSNLNEKELEESARMFQAGSWRPVHQWSPEFYKSQPLQRPQGCLYSHHLPVGIRHRRLRVACGKAVVFSDSLILVWMISIMNWNIFALSPRRVPSKARYRPRLDVLEDRTVPSTVVFNEVQSQSILSLSGTIAGSPIQEQGPGSLATTYFGTFVTDIDEVNGTISFTQTGNDFCAANTGNWGPLADGSSGTSPAIYGLQADLQGAFLAAVRDFHMNADTGGTPIAMYQNADGSFGFPSVQTIAISAGTGTYSHPNLGSGPVVLSGLSGPNQAGDGTLIDNGDGTLSVVVPISVSYSGTIAGLDLELSMAGQITGTGAFTGPRPPGSHSSRDATLGGALLSHLSPIANTPLAATGTNQTAPINSVEIALARAAKSPSVQDGSVGHAPVHKVLPTTLDQLDALDSVFQDLA